MQFARLSKDIAEKVFIVVRNNNAAQIARGTPVVFLMNGTRDGLDVDVPSVSTAAKATSFFAGILPKAIPTLEQGLAQVYGLCNALLLTRSTRAASTDSYASGAAIALGDRLDIETVGDGMSRSDAGVQAIHLPFCAAGETLASIASSASASSDSSLKVQSTIKGYLHAM